MVCADQLVLDLLRAGGDPLAMVRGHVQTPLDVAMTRGCVETLGLLLGALASRPAEQRAAIKALVAYARLPGAAVSPESLNPLLGRLGVVHRMAPHRAAPLLEAAPSEPTSDG